METAQAIEAIKLTKRYGELLAVDELEFGVAPGEIFSLLGPNGAGKSTTISMLCGLVSPTAGEALVMGRSVRRQPRAVKAAIGLVPQEVALYPDLTARENLMFWGRMYRLSGQTLQRRVAETLEIIGLAERQHGRLATFSGGMKRRVNIGAALLHHPPVIIMDEPTVGVDPQSRRHILDSIKQLNRGGTTVLYTTHYMEEAQELSHRIGIMDRGRLVALGTHAELVRIIGGQDRIVLRAAKISRELAGDWRALAGVGGVTLSESPPGEPVEATILAGDSRVVVPRVVEAAMRRGGGLMSMEIEEPNLEAVFLHLTGRALRD